MGEVIVIGAFSDFRRRFRVPKVRQRKLHYAGMLFTGETLVPEGSFLTGLQMVEKFVELRVVFAPIVNCSPCDTQVNC